MSKFKQYPSQEELKKMYYYDGEYLKQLPFKGRHKNNIGKTIGFIHRNGYRIVKIKSKAYFYHRLLWIFLFGNIPEGYEIDHINHKKDDNRLENLRAVKESINSKNMPMSVKNMSGVPGITWNKRLCIWIAQISVNYKKIHLGCFENIADAYVCYKAACRKYGFHINHGK